jgi:hypothetical protein
VNNQPRNHSSPAHTAAWQKASPNPDPSTLILATTIPNKPQKIAKYKGNNSAARDDTVASQLNCTKPLTVPARNPSPKPFQPTRTPAIDPSAHNKGISATHANAPISNGGNIPATSSPLSTTAKIRNHPAPFIIRQP